jgi:tetratricopeptide (TPR) repeat protein
LARKRKPDRFSQPSAKRPDPAKPGMEVSVRQMRDGNGWELVHPRCARERKEDLEEVEAMIEGGAPDVAQEELRWLLNGCSDFLAAHYLLGVLAVDDAQDLELARGHFGYAYQLGLTALRQAGSPRPVPYQSESNQAFFEAGKGLAYCLRELGKPAMAAEVLDELIGLDPESPIGLSEMRAKLNPGEVADLPDQPDLDEDEPDENDPLRIIEL